MADLVYTGKTDATLLNASAMPTNADMQIYKGDYVEIFVTVKDSLDVPLSLTDITPRASLKVDYSSTESTPFICTKTGEPGEVRIYLPSSVSATLSNSSYIWDFELVNLDDDSRTYLTGDVTVLSQVTNG